MDDGVVVAAVEAADDSLLNEHVAIWYGDDGDVDILAVLLLLSNEVVDIVVDTVVNDRFVNCKEIVDGESGIALRLKGNRHRLPRHVGNIIVGEYRCKELTSGVGKKSSRGVNDESVAHKVVMKFASEWDVSIWRWNHYWSWIAIRCRR